MFSKILGGIEGIKMRVYNKIVRDKIPDIIARNNGKCKTKVIDDANAINYLRLKICEEAKELIEVINIEEKAIGELADILECIYAIASKMSIPMDRIEFARSNKLEDRGGFDKNIILLETEEVGK